MEELHRLNFSGFRGVTNYFNYYTSIPKPVDFDCVIDDKLYIIFIVEKQFIVDHHI